MKKIICSILLVITLLLILTSLVTSDLSTLGQNLDSEEGGAYWPDTAVGGFSHGLRLEDSDNGSSYIYAKSFQVGGDDKIYTYRVSYSGTFVGTTFIDSLALSGHDFGTIVLVNDSVDPKLYCSVGHSTDTDYLNMQTFTITSTGIISSVIETATVAGLSQGINGLDAIYVADGVVLLANTGQHSGLGYDTIRTIPVASDGDIYPAGAPDIDLQHICNACGVDNANPSIFPISNNLTGDDWEIKRGAGWWGLISQPNDADGVVRLESFYVDVGGNITIGDRREPTGGEGNVEGGPGDAIFSPVRLNGYSDKWLLVSKELMSVLTITNSGSITQTANDQIEWGTTVASNSPRILWAGSNRYVVMYNSATGTLRFAGFNYDNEDISITDTITQEENPSYGRMVVDSTKEFWADGDSGVFHTIYEDSDNNYVETQSFYLYSPPSVDTTGFASIGDNNADISGEILDTGSNVSSTVGICWSGTTSTPTISGSCSATSGSFDTGSTWTDTISSLTGGVKYWVRAYATSADGTGYGDILSFATQPSFTTYVTRLEFEPEQISGSPTYTIQDQGLLNHDAVYILDTSTPTYSVNVGILESTGEGLLISSGRDSLDIPASMEDVPNLHDNEGISKEWQGSPIYPFIEAVAGVTPYEVETLWHICYIAALLTSIILGQRYLIIPWVTAWVTLFPSVIFWLWGPLPFWIIMVQLIIIIYYTTSEKREAL